MYSLWIICIMRPFETWEWTSWTKTCFEKEAEQIMFCISKPRKMLLLHEHYKRARYICVPGVLFRKSIISTHKARFTLRKNDEQLWTCWEECGRFADSEYVRCSRIGSNLHMQHGRGIDFVNTRLFYPMCFRRLFPRGLVTGWFLQPQLREELTRFWATNIANRHITCELCGPVMWLDSGI